MDGVHEWSFPNDVISKWGLQDMFDTGTKAIELTIPSEIIDVFALNYPIINNPTGDSYESKGNMMFSLSAINSPLDGVEIAVSVGGNELFSETIGLILNSYSYSFRFTDARNYFRIGIKESGAHDNWRIRCSQN